MTRIRVKVSQHVAQHNIVEHIIRNEAQQDTSPVCCSAVSRLQHTRLHPLPPHENKDSSPSSLLLSLGIGSAVTRQACRQQQGVQEPGWLRPNPDDARHCCCVLGLRPWAHTPHTRSAGLVATAPLTKLWNCSGGCASPACCSAAASSRCRSRSTVSLADRSESQQWCECKHCSPLLLPNTTSVKNATDVRD